MRELLLKFVCCIEVRRYVGLLREVEVGEEAEMSEDGGGCLFISAPAMTKIFRVIGGRVVIVWRGEAGGRFGGSDEGSVVVFV